MQKELQSSGLQLETPERILDLFKELAKIQIKQENSLNQEVKIKNLKRCLDSEIQKNQLVFNQMSTDLNHIQKKFNQGRFKSAVNIKKTQSRTFQNIRQKLNDYQEELKQSQKFVTDQANRLQKIILNERLKLVDLQQICQTNSQFFLSSNQLKLNSLSKKIQHGLNHSLSSIMFDVKQEYRNLRLQIQKQKKETIRSQKQMYQKLNQIQQLLNQTVKQQQKQLNKNFSKHYDALQKIFEVISQDLLTQQEM